MHPLISFLMKIGIILGVALGVAYILCQILSIAVPYDVTNVTNYSNDTMNLSNTNIDNSATEVNSIFSRSIGTLIYMLTIALVAMAFILIIKVGCRL